MNNIEHDNDADLAEFMAGWDWVNTDERVTATYAVIGLTNFGERPVESTRLAEILDVPVSEAEVRAREWGWPGTRVEDGLITVNPERARSAPRRHVQIGDRRFGVTGCAGDIFQYAPLVRPSLHLEETCPVTGTLIRIVFTPRGVERVDPAGAVMPMPDPRDDLMVRSQGDDVEEIDANVCAQGPLFSSAEAAQGWLDAHAGSRAFPVREAWDLSIYRDWRDKMSALLNLGN